MTTKTLAAEFTERLKLIEKRAKKAGSNVTQLCRSTGISRATYERWCFRPPGSVAKFDQLEAELARLEKEAAQYKAEDEVSA